MIQMASKGSDTVVGRYGQKAQVWAIAFFAFMLAGCAVSERPPSSISVVPASAEPQPPAGEPLEASADEDFDFLEDELAEQKIEVPDPLEPLNRLTYGVNDALYFWVAKPAVQIYTGVTPEPARLGIRNFFHNLTTPVRLANCLLQGKGDAAGTEFNRFVVNTTAGVLGFGDPARDKYGLEPVAEDLGQTLAIYGLGNGFYLVLPVLGPSTARDSVGKVGDMFLNPVFYVEPTELAAGITGAKYINEGSFHIGEYEAFKSAAVDPYVAMREAYIQYRAKQIKE